MAEFRTKYDPFPRNIRIMDNHDNVDRLSYLAPADLIRRFMSSGEDYLRNRKVAFAQGLYGQDEDLNGDDKAQALPVYVQDIVDLERQTEESRILMQDSVEKYNKFVKALEKAKTIVDEEENAEKNNQSEPEKE